MSFGVSELWPYLGIDTGEEAALSLVLERVADEFFFRCGSLVFGPSEMAKSSWPAWRLKEGHSPAPSEHDLKAPPSFFFETQHFAAGRIALSEVEARQWVTELLETGAAPAVRSFPVCSASLSNTRAPILITTQSESAAGDLATWLARPVRGFFFDRADEPAEIDPDEPWTICGNTFFAPAMSLLGLAWFENKTGPPPSGLLVGRLERRAWLAGQRLRPEHDLYSVEIGFEPDRVSISDLELEIEERVGDELVVAERLRCEDLDVLFKEKRAREAAGSASGRPVFKIDLPTLGRGVRRAVRLYHRDGMLLDEWSLFSVAESIGMTMIVNGTPQPTSWTGDRRDAPDLVEMLGSVERVRSQYATLRRTGLVERLFDDPAQGRHALRAHLELARGQVLALDPWLRDWSVLTDLPSGPPRVLIGPDVPDPPPAFPGQVARYKGTEAPFHDRFFLWEGGGVSVGTSLGSSRARLFRIARIASAESYDLRERFAIWWSDPSFTRVL